MSSLDGRRRPEWLKVRIPSGEGYFRLRELLRKENLHTVCEGARCPNIGECWRAGTATFLILGDVCTRACRFCAVKGGAPSALDLDEPRRVAEAVNRLGLKYAVITSVTRDDLDDGGSEMYAETIRRLRESVDGIRIEVLIPDFRGRWEALRAVVEARPDVLGHNIETVPRLYAEARGGADYLRSLELLRRAKRCGVPATTKSGLMLGLGERKEEILKALEDLRQAEVDVVTLGQYLQPTREHLPVARFYTPEEFLEFRDLGYALGFSRVASAPLVRSSYHAEEYSLQAAVDDRPQGEQE